MTAVATLPAVSVADSVTSMQPPVRVLNPLEVEHWDEMLAAHPAASFFHTKAWAQALVNSYKFACHYVAAVRGTQLLGVLPIMETRSWLRGMRAVSLPFTDDAEMLTTRECSREALMDSAAQLASERGWKTLDMCTNVELEAGASHFTHTLPLDQNAAAIFDGCESATRRAIRKAERCGVTVRLATDLASLREYYRLHCRTRTRLGSPPQPFRFFQAIAENIFAKDRGFVALALYQGRPIGGAVFFEFNGRAIYKFSASDERFQEMRGANLVIWRAIEKLIAGGAHELSFGRTSLANTGLRRFKLGWGTEERLRARIRYSFATGSFVRLRDLTNGTHVRWFAALPVWISRCIGALVYPHLS